MSVCYVGGWISLNGNDFEYMGYGLFLFKEYPYDKETCEIFLGECIIPLLNNSIETIGHKNSLKPHQLNECRNDCGDKQESLLGMT